jgi:hypothetical protein
MGDSHLDSFTYFCAAICRIPGATSYGLTKQNSITKAREAFQSFLSVFPHYVPILCVGEVDCNSLPWRIENFKSPKEVIHHSINNLFTFIQETNRKFILPSVTLPTVDSFKELKFRSFVTANKEERTTLVKFYNTLLHKKALEHGHVFLDITTPSTGPDGLVNSAYIRTDTDVHLVPHKLRPIIADLLDKVFL